MNIHVKTCATPDCNLSAVGKSKYCREHRAIARANFKAKIAADKAARETRYAEFSRLTNEADKAGIKAGQDVVPTPMLIKGYEPIADGVCGFAWVTVRPGNCSYAIWAKKNCGFRKAYNGGVQLWISDFNQSMTRKEAYAQAFAKTLRAEGIEAYAGSRMD